MNIIGALLILVLVGHGIGELCQRLSIHPLISFVIAGTVGWFLGPYIL